ncbi:MAG TPA: DUF2889 domain-containing protein [Acidimicrobiales bacterium]|nr:DUF2889 domain-containing protein [Acidimicrobiales bacterium]
MFDANASRTDPRPGPHRALATTPPVAPGAARRTTSIDVTRPDGLLGPCAIVLRGRDVAAVAGGRTEVAAEVALTVRVDPAGRLGEATGPGAAVLEPLAGASLRSGFGRRLAEALPGDLERRALVASLLEDMAGAFLVSGYAPLRAGLLPADPATATQRAALQADVCIGWRVGGLLHRVLAEEGRSAVPLGPTAPAIERADPAGWHDLPPLGEGTVRRRRLLEAVLSSAGTGAAIRAHFRDSHAGGDGETVMHEYAVDAEVDGDGRIARVDVDPRVLPWEACPLAVASAARVVGVALADLPGHVRADVVGTSTCTHLNSTLRSLADARALLAPAGLGAPDVRVPWSRRTT